MEFLMGLFVDYPIVGVVLAGLGSLLVFASAIVKLTPSKKDDEMLENLKKNSIFKKMFEILEKFSVISKK